MGTEPVDKTERFQQKKAAEKELQPYPPERLKQFQTTETCRATCRVSRVACGITRSQECSKGFEDLGLGTWVMVQWSSGQWAVVLFLMAVFCSMQPERNLGMGQYLLSIIIIPFLGE